MKTTKRLTSILCVLLVCVMLFTMTANAASSLPTLKRNGSANTTKNVKVLQQMLTTAGYSTKGVDGSFGRNTETAVKNFQTAKLGKKNADGVVGSKTWNALLGDKKITLKYGSSGALVKMLQQILISKGYSCGPCGADGDFGYDTETAVINFQKAKGLKQDGIVGKDTWTKLLLAYF